MKNICDKKMSLDDCEMALLRHAIEETEDNQQQEQITEKTKQIIDILKHFMIKKMVICYGGTAINNILPKKAQFYGPNEIPDFDFYSKTPLIDAKLLTDIYYKKGFKEVEAKAGVHAGTFKVFVNYIPIADITYLEEDIFDNILKESIIVRGIHYAPPNFLRMSMFLELSRPSGDVSRWEKVFSRLKLLNKYYPLKIDKLCSTNNIEITEAIDIVFKLLQSLKVVFFGGYAFNLYLSERPQNNSKEGGRAPTMDVLSENYEKNAVFIVKSLKKKNINAILKKNNAIGEIIPENIEIMVDDKIVACLYNPIACYSYNEITLNHRIIKIASIDTILSFYLAFIYVNKTPYEKDRILCMAEILFNIQEKQRTENNGILKRFSVNCYGKQKTLVDIRAEKTDKYKELLGKVGTEEYDWWFLRYRPTEKKNYTKKTKQNIFKKTRKNKNLLLSKILF
jgi:hypothetical protein